MNTAQKIWDNAHPVKIGQTLQPGTEIVKVEHRDIFGWIHEVHLGVIKENELLEITDDYMVRFVRTVERQTDRIDTGPLEFHEYDGFIKLYGVNCWYTHVLTANQARNLARKILEALDD